jgi:hypothetical protein
MSRYKRTQRVRLTYSLLAAFDCVLGCRRLQIKDIGQKSLTVSSRRETKWMARHYRVPHHDWAV